MWNEENIAGFREAVASERVDRAIAFIGLPERIGDIECSPLTPERMEWLHAYSNAHMCGGEITDAGTLQFLWFVSPEFKPGKDPFNAFVSALGEVESWIDDAEDDIDRYIERAFMDAPYYAGKRMRAPIASVAADLVTAMAGEPFRWPMAKTMRTDLRIIYQLLKCRDKSAGLSVVNRRSDKVVGDWLGELQVITEPTLKKLHETIATMPDWKPVSEPSPNAITQTGTNDKGQAMATAGSWSVSMARKAVNRGE